MDETVVEQIVRSLSFEVVAIPDDAIEVDHPTKSTPVNVKIRVRKKADTGLPDGVISTSKVDRKDFMPGRIRLVSSDQTIMSFNVVMDNEYNQNLMLQPGSSYKAEIATGSGIQSDGVMKNRFTLSKKDKLNTSPVLSKRNKDFFGKCKPGGCLDPPFGEDSYAYKPTKKTPFPVESSVSAAKETTAPVKSSILPAEETPEPVKGLIMPSKKTSSSVKVSAQETTSPVNGTITPIAANESNRTRSSSIFKNMPFKKKKIEKRDQDDQRFKNETDSQTKIASVLNLFQTGSLEESTYSNSIITYPPTTNTSDQQIQERRHSKISHSRDEISGTASYFIVPKKTKKLVDQSNKKPENENTIGDNEQNKTEDLHDSQHEPTLLKTSSEPKISDQTNLAPLLIPLGLPLLSAIDAIHHVDENTAIQTNESTAQSINGINNGINNFSDEDPRSVIINKLRHSVESKDLMTEKNENLLITERKSDSYTREFTVNKPSTEEIQLLQLAQEPELIFIKTVNNLDETETNEQSRADLPQAKFIPVISDEKNVISKDEDEQEQLLSSVTEEKTSFIQKDDNVTKSNKSENISNSNEIKNDFKDDSKIFIPDIADHIALSADKYNTNGKTDMNNKTISDQNIIVERGNNDLDNSTIPTDLKYDNRESIQTDQDIKSISENIITPLKSEADNFIADDVKTIPKYYDEQFKAAEIRLSNDIMSIDHDRAKDIDYPNKDKVTEDVSIKINQEFTSGALNTSNSDLDIVTDCFEEIPAMLEEDTLYVSTFDTTKTEDGKKILYGQSHTTTHHISVDKNLDKPLEFQNEHILFEGLANSYEFSNKNFDEGNKNKKEIYNSQDNNDTLNDIMKLTSSDEKDPPKLSFESEPQNGNIEDSADYENILDNNLTTILDESKTDKVLEGQFRESSSEKPTRDLGIKVVIQPPRMNGTEIPERDRLLDPKDDPSQDLGIEVVKPPRIHGTEIPEIDKLLSPNSTHYDVFHDSNISSSILNNDVETWEVDFALHSYINKQNERVIKSFDSDNVPDEYQNDALIIAKRSLEKDSNSIKIPLDKENELTILINNNKTNQSLANLNNVEAKESHTVSSQKKRRIETPGNEVENTDYDYINKSKAKHHVNDDYNLRDALISIYEQELVPLQDVIKDLREEIDLLSTYRMMLYEKSKTKRLKQQRISHSNRCGCSRRI